MITFVNIIRLSILIIGLFANETVVGMILRRKNVNNSIRAISMDIISTPVNSNTPAIIDNDTLGHNIWPALNREILYNHILLPYCGRQARLICQKFAQYDTILPKLYSYYWNTERQVVPACAFLDCVNKGDLKKVEWFLKKKLDRPMFCVCDNQYLALNPYMIALARNNHEMMMLLYKYKINIYKQIKDAQLELKNDADKVVKELCDSTVSDILSYESLKSRNVEEKIISFVTFNEVFLERHLKKEYKFESFINYNVCMAACCGDIRKFESKYDDPHPLGARNELSLPLVVLIASRNYDVEFLLNLQKNCTEAHEYMSNQHNMEKLLFSLVFNCSWIEGDLSSYNQIKIKENTLFAKKHIEGIKKLIEIKIFTTIPQFIQNNITTNKGIKEIYWALKGEPEPTGCLVQ